MKFSEAIRMNKTHSPYEGVMWLLTSYNPFIFTAYLQAHLIQATQGRSCLEVKQFDYDVLHRTLQETSFGDQRYDPAVLSLVWEDFIPELGWRSRQTKAKTEEVNYPQPSSVLRESILCWAQERAKVGGLSIVLMPSFFWLPPWSASPAFLFDALKADLSAWAGVFSQHLLKHGVRICENSAMRTNLREMLRGGCPWTLEEAREMATKVALLIAPREEPVKAIVVDLDNTLWPGILEDESALGFAEQEWQSKPHHVFSRLLLEQRQKGIFLGCCSKNDQDVVVKYFDRLNPVFSFSDFNAVSINWDPKSLGIRKICSQLNILPGNVLFIDDNPAEILEVQNIFPQIKTLKMPAQGEAQEWSHFYSQFCQFCFRPTLPSKEDRIRVEDRHAVERRFLESAESAAARKTYLRSLQLHLEIRTQAWQEHRAMELLNKTNQFTLNGHRYTLSQWMELGQKEGAWCLTGHLSDVHGDFGTIAVMVGVSNHEETVVEALAVSCRAFDRNVEYAFLQALLKVKGCQKLRFLARETGRNTQTLKYLRSLGLSWEKNGVENVTILLGLLEERIAEAGLEVIFR